MMVDHHHIIPSGTYAERIRHFAEQGFTSYEIASMLHLDERQVRIALQAIDRREEHTTDNC